MSEVLGIGVVGLGSVFEPYAELLRRLRLEGRLRVVRTCDVDPRLADASEHYLYEKVPFCTDYAEVVADPAVDAVVILTSMPHHGPIALEAMQAGKHVLVEKPMSVDLPGAEAILELPSGVSRCSSAPPASS